MNVNKNKQHFPLTDCHLEVILKTPTSYTTPEYEKLVAEKRCDASPYV
jgi:hypothetical protein